MYIFVVVMSLDLIVIILLIIKKKDISSYERLNLTKCCGPRNGQQGKARTTVLGRQEYIIQGKWI